MRCASRKWILFPFIFQFTAAFRALNPLLHPNRVFSLPAASTVNSNQVFVTLKKFSPRPSISLRCKASDPRNAPAEDPFSDVDESVLRLQTERDKVFIYHIGSTKFVPHMLQLASGSNFLFLNVMPQVLAELDLERAVNVHGDIGAREKVLLCALNTLEESVGSVYGLQSPQVRPCPIA